MTNNDQPTSTLTRLTPCGICGTPVAASTWHLVTFGPASVRCWLCIDLKPSTVKAVQS